MRVLGVVKSMQDNKLAVHLEEQNLPKIGKEVFDDQGNSIGAVFDYIGQAKKPYIVVTCSRDPEKHLGKKVYV